MQVCLFHEVVVQSVVSGVVSQGKGVQSLIHQDNGYF